MRDLTARQQEILELIRQHIADTGFPPTRAEIASKLGFRSANAAEEHLKALARKGMLELTSGASRGIRLIGAGGSDGILGKSPPVRPLWAGGFSLPLIGRVAAGSPILSQEHIEQHYQFDAALFREKPDYLLKVRGMSMRDAGILEGDLLVVDRAIEPRAGRVVVAVLEGAFTLKYLNRHQGRWRLEAAHPDYPPLELAERDDARIWGVAIHAIHSL